MCAVVPGRLLALGPRLVRLPNSMRGAYMYTQLQYKSLVGTTNFLFWILVKIVTGCYNKLVDIPSPWPFTNLSHLITKRPGNTVATMDLLPYRMQVEQNRCNMPVHHYTHWICTANEFTPIHVILTGQNLPLECCCPKHAKCCQPKTQDVTPRHSNYQ